MNKRFLLIGNDKFVEDIKPFLSKLVLEVKRVFDFETLKSALIDFSPDIIVFDKDSYKSNPVLFQKNLNIVEVSKIPFFISSLSESLEDVFDFQKYGSKDFLSKPFNHREILLKVKAVFEKKYRVSSIGGGTGLFNLLMGLKELDDVFLTSIVSTSDDGGSSGRLKAAFGGIPAGDIRRNLVALSTTPDLMDKVMQYRFKKAPGLSGHSLGNLLITALSDITGSMPEAVRAMGDILNIKGIVNPATITNPTLCAKFENGKVIKGESNIDLGVGRDKSLKIIDCWHEPPSKADTGACSSIINSDMVTIGPGDLFTSIITNLLVKAIRDAIIDSPAVKVYICNLMTKPGETYGFDAANHISEIIKYLKSDSLDYILINDTNKLSKSSVKKYSKKNQFPVFINDINEIKKITKARIVIADIANETEVVRHDPDKIRAEIRRIILDRKNRR